MPLPETDVVATRKRDLVIRTLRIDVTAGPDRGKSVESTDEITIGTAPSCSLVLADTTVSRIHVAIRPHAGGWVLRDLGSTNGTALAGVRVIEAIVAPGQTLSIGQTTLQIAAPGTVAQQVLSDDATWGAALGTSTAMRRLFALLPRIAASDATVLLDGETGTGKTLLADAIHQHSDRRAGPFVVVDCGAISPTLVESALFGHERGAFTGAVATHLGAFERATGGTVFFDDFGQLPLDLQPKLLRALEERSIVRVGGTAPIAVDVRVIAATNRDLRLEVNRGVFRADLYYRLNTIQLRVPALRERREDIPLLAEHFWRQVARDETSAPPDELLDELIRRDWPGNVRELRSAVERAVLLGDPDVLVSAAEVDQVDRDVALVEGEPFRVAKERVVSTWERAYVRTLVDRHQGNLSRAARTARMDRSYLRELLRQHWPARDVDDK